MSIAILHSRALVGLASPEVRVEVHLGAGLPGFTLVGLPEAEVRESRERVRSAIQNSQFDFPNRRITVNLAPADLPKESGRYDLPIALGILIASGQVEGRALSEYEFAGELSLTGELRSVRGALPMCLGAREAHRALFLPEDCAADAARLEGAQVLPARHLLDVCAHLNGQTQLTAWQADSLPAEPPVYPDLGDVKGQAQAKRALQVAAAGGHSLLMVGPPGSGKSMLAARLPGILPPMTEEEALESAAIQTLRAANAKVNWGERPMRSPHHSASSAALVGGGADPMPGEISLAHHGVLFMDELPEFDRRVLEALREPLETGHITVPRAARQVEYPASFQWIAAMNPCPCGYLGHTSGRCRCTPDQVDRYRGKLSGPLRDRIDILLEVPALSQQEMTAIPTSGAASESAGVRAQVIRARNVQLARQGKPNARLGAKETERVCQAEDAARILMQRAIDQLGLSARGYHRVLRLARTLADLAGENQISVAHMAEAIQYRRNGVAVGGWNK